MICYGNYKYLKAGYSPMEIATYFHGSTFFMYKHDDTKGENLYWRD